MIDGVERPAHALYDQNYAVQAHTERRKKNGG